MIGLVWRRRDFRESSRLVTILTRDRGPVTALGKGAHRARSPMLGHIDWLSLVDVSFGRGELPILRSVRLLHEPRSLRRPGRFLVAAWFGEMFDPAWIEGRVDHELFDLTQGAIGLAERAPAPLLARFVAGVELRYLDQLGLAPDLDACSVCGEPFSDGAPAYPTNSSPVGLRCRKHRAAAEQSLPPLPPEARAWLATLRNTPARRWHELPGADPSVPRSVPAALRIWLQAGLERPFKQRGAAWRAIAEAARTSRDDDRWIDRSETEVEPRIPGGEKRTFR